MRSTKLAMLNIAVKPGPNFIYGFVADFKSSVCLPNSDRNIQPSEWK